MEQQYTHDLFISCANADLAWVEGFLLPALSLPAERVITFRQFVPGASLIAEFERAVRDSRYTILVLTPAYLADVWPQFAAELASFTSVAERQNRIIPLLREPCELPLHIDFRVGLDCTAAANWESEIGRARELLDQPEPKAERIPCPYPGLAPFNEHEAERFFGREDEIADLRRRLRYHNFQLIMGPSGSGKSSLVFAGLVSDLRKHQPGQWTARDIRPGSTPLDALNTAVGDLINLDTLQPSGLQTPRFLLIVDQLEEIFVQVARPVQSDFIAALKILLQVPNCSIVATLRADFYSDLMDSDLWPIDPSHRLEVVPLRGDALRRAIQQPATDAGVYLESSLLERLLADVADEPGSLPLLQETLVLLWEGMERRFLSLASYAKMGDGKRSGLAVSMATKADSVLGALSAEQRTIARRIIIRLVQFGVGRPDTRRQQFVSDLMSAGDDEEAFRNVLEHLVRNRLLTSNSAEEARDREVDIAHDAPIWGWPGQQAWMNKRRDAELHRRRLEERAEAWEVQRAALLDSVELANARRWSEDYADELGCSATLLAMIATSDKVNRRNARLRLAVATAIVMLVIGILATIAVTQYQLNDQQRSAAATAQVLANAESHARTTAEAEAHARATEVAIRSAAEADAKIRAQEALARQLLAQAESLYAREPGQYDLALLLGVESMKRLNSPEGSDFLYRGLSLLPKATQTITHNSEVKNRLLSPNGMWLATSKQDNTVEIVSVENSKIVAAITPDTPPSSMTFSPNGRWLATLGNPMQVWDVITAEEQIRSSFHVNWDRMAFDPTGQFLAVSEDAQTRVYDLTAGELSTEVSSAKDVRVLAFSQTGRMLAAATDNGTYIWDAATGASLVTLPTPERTYRIIFDPLDELLITAEDNGTISFWNIDSGTVLTRTRQLESINDLVLSPDGQWLAAGSYGGMLAAWALPEGAASIHVPDRPTLIAMPDPNLWTNMLSYYYSGFEVVSFNQNGTMLATIGDDGVTRVWDTMTMREIARITDDSAIDGVAFAPNGILLITTSPFHTRSWDIGLKVGPSMISKKEGYFEVTLRSDGEQLAATIDQQVRLWSTRSWGNPSVLSESRNIEAVAFDPASNKIAVATATGLHIWDTAAQTITAIIPNSANISQLEFSPDGKWLTGTQDRTIRVWDAEHWSPAIQNACPEPNECWFGTFSPDGRWMAVRLPEDRIARLSTASWQVVSSVIAKGHITGLSFTPSGNELIATALGFASEKDTTSRDGTLSLHVWKGMNGDHMILDRTIEYTVGPEGFIESQFSPNGRWLALIQESTVRILDLTTMKEVNTVSHKSGRIYGLAFSPDDELIATAGTDQIVRVWKVSTGHEEARFSLDGMAWLVGFSADNHSLLINNSTADWSSGRLQAHYWRGADLMRETCSRLWRNLALEEWSTYFASEPYRRTCDNLP